jgi:hypothetical protein
MGTMTDCLKRLGCDPVLPFAPTDPSIIADYQVVHTAFANGDKTNPRVAARLRSVTVVLGEFGAAPGLFDDLFQGSSITIVKREDSKLRRRLAPGPQAKFSSRGSSPQIAALRSNS